MSPSDFAVAAGVDSPPSYQERMALLEDWNEARKASEASRKSLCAYRAGRNAARPLHNSLIDALGTVLVELVGKERDSALEFAAEMERDLAETLIAGGPIRDEVWDYRGADVGGLLQVIREPREAHAAKDHDRAPRVVLEDDGSPD